MRCDDCPRYDLERDRCRDGKVNPPDYEQAVNVANVIGIRSICVFNDHRERLLLTRRLPVEQMQRRATERKLL
ncbi:MAG: hypothetical protein ACK4XJ_03260 [Fimbriimonadaceae bacterium]